MMKKWDRFSLAAVIAAACLLATAAFYPPAPRGAWWCTAFSVVCSEAAEQQDTPDAAGQTVAYRWKIAEWWQSFAG